MAIAICAVCWSPNMNDLDGVLGPFYKSLPEEEIRQHYKINADGSVGTRLTHPSSAKAKEFEYERFSTLETRALVIIPYPERPKQPCHTRSRKAGRLQGPGS